uniref:ABC transporter permease n=1 Tax=Vaginimicrobium propionicum TaxID=1871034 RepID=UPI00097110C8|nr:ABC transporter permease [Vaginimicrobium propionicum]
MQINPTWQLALALVLLIGIAITISKVGRLAVGKQVAVAALRAIIQLALVSAVVVAAVQYWWTGLIFLVLMFGNAVWTTTGRVENRKTWGWTSLAMACGVIPVLAVIFLTGTAPFNGFAIVPIGSIIIGNVMTAHTLTGRRLFALLRDQMGVYEAALSLGFTRYEAMWYVIEPVKKEALIPNLDKTKTAGLVTLPGAFIGVLLGGGSPIQAGASQVLVLLGILCGQTLCVSVAHELIRRAKLLPDDLVTTMHH